MPVGEILLSAFLQVLFERLASRELIQFARRWKVKSELEKLKKTLLAIKAVLNDAEKKQIGSDAVRVWLDDLQHLAYDADDLLDEFATETLRRNIEAVNQVCSFTTSFKFNSVVSSKIKKITKKLVEIVKKKQDLGLIEGVGQSLSRVTEGTHTTSLPNEPHIYGRDKDVEKMIELLLSDESSDDVVSVIPIVGMGGAGKTTLAQFVYNHKNLKNHFDLKAWACVSDEFDVKRVTIAIIESATEKSCDINNLDPLQARLKKILNENKFLLVLDDVWSDKYSDWDELRKPFRAGAQGSKIIITTRSRDVASMMGSVPAHDLRLLSDDDCWSLFIRHAFENRNPNAHPNLKEIRKKIVRKCQGLPLAAKILGGLLRCKVHDEWENILKSEIWRNEEGGILSVLRVSYHHLPAHLKPCFSYCALFPKDYEFDKKNLVLLWMAEGFLQPREDERLEDIGGEYFRDLLQRSFFQESYINYESRFSMHDLINDLAQSVSREICFKLEDQLEGHMEVSEVVRHSSYLRGEYDKITLFQPLYKVQCLRTFLALDRSNQYFYFLPNKVPNDLFSKLRCLRVLCLSGYNIGELPNSIGNLIHLRYLDLSHTKIKRLPKSSCTLYNLQTLKLNECCYLMELPKYLGNLINLRHLETLNCYNLKKFPLGIGRLTRLQSLPNFIVGNTNGSVIKELREMVHLGESLSISKLKNVVKATDAIHAILENKQYLHTLELKWSSKGDNEDYSRDGRVEEEVLAKLRPNTNLQNLTIEIYGGMRFPSWIGEQSFSKIEHLKLFYCKKCESLPPLGQLSSLKYLEIRGFYAVKSVGREFYGNGYVKPFPSLKKLEFHEMWNWEQWSGVEEGEDFPCLREIKIYDCPKLRRLSICSPSLEELDITKCAELSALSNGVGLQHFASLRRLYICHCKNLKKLPQGIHNLMFLEKLKITCSGLESFPEMGLPSVLRHLEIKECENLKSLPEGILHNNTFLKFLDILNCDSLTSFPRGGLPTSLEHLSIADCSSLKSLPEGMQNNSSLKKLGVYKVPSLTSFSRGGLPISLEYLYIEDCSNLESLPEGMQNNTSLKDLRIKACHSLTSFARGRLPTSLEYLCINGCSSLQSLPEGMHNNTSLKEMKIQGCHSLTSFPRELWLPTATLKCLEIKDCKNLKSLPEGLHNLKYLDDLIINGCPLLTSFPEGGQPTTLKRFEITDCCKFESLLGLHNFTSLDCLKIEMCPALVSFPAEGGLFTKA